MSVTQELDGGCFWAPGNTSVAAQLCVGLSHVTFVISCEGLAMFYSVSVDSIIYQMEIAPVMTYAIQTVDLMDS